MTSVKRIGSADTTPASQVTPSSTSSSETSTPLAPRPAPPRQQLTARMAPLLRDLDWDLRGHIEPTTYDAVVLGYGEPAWKTAFGSAA